MKRGHVTRKKFRLRHARIQMARELGLNPKSFSNQGSISKRPLSDSSLRLENETSFLSPVLQ